jgi:hypothetical protein
VLGVATVLVAAVAISRVALYRLRDYRYPFDLSAAFQGAAATLPVTGTTAALVWSIVGLLVWAIARWLRRSTDLSPGEATAAAVVLGWASSYLFLLSLGPFGFYRPWILRVVLAAAFVLALRASTGKMPPVERVRRGWGPWIGAGAMLLIVGPLLLLQLASPVSPFMDVLPYVASTEKIVTFHFYDPLANDAAGLWPPSRQVPGCDGILSLIALVVGASGRVATTSLIVPVAALNLLSVYLLGRHVRDGLTGGMACLFLLQTFLWRRSADVRSTALAFPLVALGIAFLLGQRRSGIRAAIGGLALGLSVAVNPLIGAFGMQVASLGTIVEWLDFRRGFVVRVMALFGGVLFALPAVLIGLTIRSPLWALVLPALVGCALLLWLVRNDDRVFRRARDRPLPWARLGCLVGAVALALYFHASREVEFLPDDWSGYPVLSLLALCGMAALFAVVWRRPDRCPAAAVPALALMVGMADFLFISPWRFQGSLEIKALASASTPKIVLYWAPYWMALLAGAFLARAARRTALVPVLLVAMVLVIYPVRHVPEPLDYDGAELSVVGTWGFHLTNAARGYWAGRGDRRWVLDDNYQAIADILTQEIPKGTIDYYTHVMVISPSESVELALATGISADVVSPAFDPNGYWNLGSRMRRLDAVDEAFAQSPPYVVIEQFQPSRFPQLAAYDLVLERSYVRLYRRRSVGDS